MCKVGTKFWIHCAFIRENSKHMGSQQEKISFRRVGVVARHHTETILDSVLNVEAVLQEAGSDVVVDADTAAVLPDGVHSVVDKSVLESLDLVVVVVVDPFRCGCDTWRLGSRVAGELLL